jgi:hypothetical protein
MTHLSPFIHGRTISDGFAPMDIADSGRSQRLPRHAARCYGRTEADGETQRFSYRRPTLRDAVARAEIDAGSGGAYFLAQLRAVVAAFETPADRLLAKYRG